jgi:hypothetical protein
MARDGDDALGFALVDSNRRPQRHRLQSARWLGERLPQYRAAVFGLLFGAGLAPWVGGPP